MQQEVSQNNSEIHKYFTQSEWLAFALIVLAGLILRWAELEVRPYHHDESQHAMFGKYFYDFPESQGHYYKYDPMMHAPLLYNFLRFVYNSLGNTLWSARAPTALIGRIFIFLPLLFRKYFSPYALLALTAAISLSPTLVYWSRFLIHDYFVLSAMIVTLYGVLIARPQQKSFFIILGLTLQFCIKANIFVTLALLAGYLVYELFFNYFLTEKSENFLNRLWRYLLKYFLVFFVIFALLTIFAHYEISTLDPSNKISKSLIGFADQTSLFILFNFAVYLLIYLISFFIVDGKSSYLKKIFLHIRSYPKQFFVSFLFAVLVFSYIFSSGFRHLKGILDGLYRTSIPYWLNQHEMERIKGPFLFNFYIFSWYEFVFLVFFLIHLYLFYKYSPRYVKISGLLMSGLAVLLATLMLLYISPEGERAHWLSLEDLGKRKPEDLGGFKDSLVTSFIHFFKLKDCLDVVGVVLLLVHPVILTTAHLLRNEKVLAFWGYFFTASFFTYSYLGEKVPWLSMYPLVPGIIYLALFFEDWFKKQPLENFARYPLALIFKRSALVLLSIGLFFIAERLFSFSSLIVNFSAAKLFQIFTASSILDIIKEIYSTAWDNLLVFLIGLVLYLLYYTNRWTDILGQVNIKKFMFICIALFSLRISILTNFVYPGSETQLISQVHTTKEFHDLALRLRHEALTNIRPQRFRIYVDGDPTWPLTVYMIGVNDFEYGHRTQEQLKEYDVIIRTYQDDPKNIPEGFEKRRVNLRGWWVPDFNQMTLRNFLNVSVNLMPWGPSGFTYAWVLINKNKLQSGS